MARNFAVISHKLTVDSMSKVNIIRKDKISIIKATDTQDWACY
jgi:hypothetical protein